MAKATRAYAAPRTTSGHEDGRSRGTQRSCADWARKKTDLARTLVGDRRFRIAVIARALDVARSNLYEQRRLGHTETNASAPKPQYLVDIAQVVRKYVDERPTYGYRRITALIRRDSGLRVNHKRIYRVMKQHCWLLQRHAPRPARTHTGKIITARSNTRWCTDAFGIQCWNGEQLQVAFS
ncbi:MAG: hypothetical protein EOO38_14355 [Cytophagaceae bacterium]|nr:MAG: hypothetical protein EOO38_14355 [Cytophagaceae bacterium]